MGGDGGVSSGRSQGATSVFRQYDAYSPLILLRGSTVGAFDGETLVSPSRSIRVPGDDISALHPIRGSHVTSGVCVPMGASSAHAASNHMSYGHPPTG